MVCLGRKIKGTILLDLLILVLGPLQRQEATIEVVLQRMDAENALFASKDPSTPPAFGDPEGGAHGCAPFFDLAMDGESKNPRNNETIGLPCRGEPFFGYFLWLCKESNSPQGESL